MRRFIAALSLSVLTVPSALRADDIVVYRGTARVAADSESASTSTPTVRAYWVVNYTTGELTQILYYNKLGKKQSAATVPVKITTAILPNNKVATLLTRGSDFENADDDFGTSMLMMRGQNVALTIETNPAKRAIERPRAITLRTIGILASPGSPTNFQDATGTAAVDVAKTVDANNGDKDLATVRGGIMAELTERGYQEL